MKIRMLICVFPVMLLASCTNTVFVSDKDFVESRRVYSPDKTMLILDYAVDHGALGYGRGGTAILKTTDLNKNLRQFNLPDNLIQAEWVDNKTISAWMDIIPFIRKGERLSVNDTEVNGVKIKVTALDYIESDYHLEIEHREVSPDGRLELVAYRYLKDRSSLSFIHVSIINKGDQIPKYGNYFIADMRSDRILFGTWGKNNSLVFYSNSLYAQDIKYFFVHEKPDIKYEIITDDETYGSKYRWVAVK